MTGNRLRLQTLTCCGALGALALGITGTASAQETVIAGGSGQAAIEIHMDALDWFDRPAPLADRHLRHPGELGGGLGPVVLIPPDAPRDTADGAPSAEPLDMTPEPEPAPEPMIAATETQRETPREISKPQKQEAPAAADKAPSETKVTSVDRATEGPTGNIQVFFDNGSSDLTPDALREITSIANALESEPTQRLQLKAYAAASSDSASQARRLSLTRALTVRSALIEKGVRSTRIDVRALGRKNAGDTPDRVDIFIIKR